jgi:hypothetical protein
MDFRRQESGGDGMDVDNGGGGAGGGGGEEEGGGGVGGEPHPCRHPEIRAGGCRWNEGEGLVLGDAGPSRILEELQEDPPLSGNYVPTGRAFRKVRKLARALMGDVYHYELLQLQQDGRYVATGESVAIKTFKKQLVESGRDYEGKQCGEQPLKENRFLKYLSDPPVGPHPCVVQVCCNQCCSGRVHSFNSCYYQPYMTIFTPTIHLCIPAMYIYSPHTHTIQTSFMLHHTNT